MRYEAVNAILLNEFLKEHRKVEEQTWINQQQELALAQQAEQIEKLTNLLRRQQAQLKRIDAQMQSTPPTPRLADN